MKIGLLAVVLVLCARAQTQIDAPTQIKNLPYLDARTYNFKPIKPGGTLNSGGANVTMSPFPQGLAAGYTLYVSGGSGTAEACSITGVSSPTISLNCINTHSGAYQITSATNGLNEAVQVLKAAGVGGVVRMSAGVFSQCGTVTVDTDGITIMGAGSTGTGPKQSGGTGGAGTQIKPCFANQVLFNVPNGYGYGGAGTLGTTVAKLSMHDIGFSNNGLAGITAIKLLRDAGGVYTKLNFAGTTNAFYGFYCDRCWGTEITDITSSGTAGTFFGSSVDGVGEWTYATVKISQWMHDGPGVALPVMTWQRCVNCSLHNAEFIDEAGGATGIAIAILNDSQGNVLEDVLVESFLTGLEVLSNTVGATTAAPGWNTFTDYQYDYAGGAANIVGLLLGTGTFETSLINSTMTAPTSNGVAISVNGPPVSGHNVARIVGGLFQFTQPVAQIAVNTGVAGLTVVGNTFETSSPGTAIYLTSGAISNLNITGNQLLGTGNDLVNTATVTTSYISGNQCTNDSVSGFCNGLYGPAWNRDSQSTTFATLPTCISNLIGTRAIVSNSNTNTWGATIAGGGANVVQAFCNGSNWTVTGK